MGKDSLILTLKTWSFGPGQRKFGCTLEKCLEKMEYWKAGLLKICV
jgi:hypothetical protein